MNLLSTMNESKKITYRVKFSSFYFEKLECREPGSFRGLDGECLSESFLCSGL